MRTTIWTYPWDLIDDGPEEFFSIIRERAGIGGVSPAASYHAGSFILPHNRRRKVYFPEDGVLYFRPDRDLYGRIKPQVSRLADDVDPLRLAADSARRHGLTVTAWTVLLHNSRLGGLYPEFTMRNAFGDRLIFALCPSAGPAREYAVALVRDLAINHDLDLIELETFEFMGYRHGFHHEKAGVELTPIADFLLGLCFCDSCRERAEKSDVDVDSLREAVRGRLERFFEHTGPERPIAEEIGELDEATGGELSAFLQARRETVHSLLAEFKSAAEGKIALRPILEHRPELTSLCGIDTDRLPEIADQVTILAYRAEPEEVIRYAGEWRAALPEGIDPAIGLHGGEMYVDGPENIRRKITGLKDSGIGALSFYNYGFIRLQNLEWIGTALAGL